MLNVNDDMDDFLKKAAEEYPLKINGSDWDKVAAGLQGPGATPPGSNYKRFLWLLLLLPLVIAVPLYNNRNAKKQPALQQAASKNHLQNKNDKNSKENKPAANNTIAINNSAATTATAPEKQAMQSSAGVITKADNKYINNNNIDAGINSVPVYTPQNKAFNQGNTVLPAGIPGNNASKNTSSNRDDYTLSNNPNSGTGAEPVADAVRNDIVNSNKKDSGNKPAATDSADLAKKANNKKPPVIKKIGLYAGLAASLDATTVKFHAIKHIGYNFSFLAGYRFNNTWSIESGLMLDKKKYYSTGKYFDKSKTGLTEDYNIHFINGDCKMLEIPLNVKYDFKSKKKSGFYAVAGLSSYIMKKENYTYFTTHFSEPNAPGYFGNRGYKNSTNNFFSVANVSGGYQFIFKKNSNLRIEPYFKIPLKGLGIGKLPFTSSGVSVAYTLPLH